MTVANQIRVHDRAQRRKDFWAAAEVACPRDGTYQKARTPNGDLYCWECYFVAYTDFKRGFTWARRQIKPMFKAGFSTKGE